MDLNEIIQNKKNEKYQAANTLYQASRLADHTDYKLIKAKNNYDLAKSDKEFLDLELTKAQENYDKLCEELNKLTKEIVV
jgi:hypothetical protein